MSAEDEEHGPQPVGRWTEGRLIVGAQTMATGTARWLANLVVPALCLSCQAPLGSLDALCGSCWRKVRFIRPPLCDRLGIPMPYDTGGPIVSGAALANPPEWDRARAVAHFDPVVQGLIHGFKYADRHDARRLFGRWLVSAGAEILADADVLIPVPLHRWRLLSRKFNQAGLLAQEVGRLSGIAHEPMALRREKATPSQVGQSAVERRRNLAGAFVVKPGDRPRIEGRKIVLVDDVITTGSTVAACARVLRRAGAARIDVLALALVTDESRIGA